MKHYILISIAVLSISLSSCTQHSGHDHAKAAITLDNGNKWVVDDNMMVHVNKMVDDVEQTTSQADTDYGQLHDELRSGINALTSDCTMSGQAHDELHNWLLPFIATTNEYDAKMTADQKKDWLKNVQDAMAEFNTYFE